MQCSRRAGEDKVGLMSDIDGSVNRDQVAVRPSRGSAKYLKQDKVMYPTNLQATRGKIALLLLMGTSSSFLAARVIVHQVQYKHSMDKCRKRACRVIRG
jgi:hypothetical protein